MPKSRKTTKPHHAEYGSGCIIPEAHLNRLQVIFEQIEGMALLLFDRIQEEMETDNAVMTAYNVIKEKAYEADRIIIGSYGPMTPARLKQVMSEAPDPHQNAADPKNTPQFPHRPVAG